MQKELWSGFLKRMRENKRFSATVYLAAAVMALLLLLSLRTTPSARADNEGAVGVEERLEATLCCMRGVGNVRVMVAYGEEGAVSGAIVIAEGAADIGTQLRIREAVETVLGIEMDRVEVFEMRQSEEAE